jgi:hypothetical protein
MVALLVERVEVRAQAFSALFPGPSTAPGQASEGGVP